VEIVNHPRNWKSLFDRKKLTKKLDSFDAKTFWNKTICDDTLKASSSRYDGSDTVDHKNSIPCRELPRKIMNKMQELPSKLKKIKERLLRSLLI